MKYVLIISYALGGTSPVGIGTERILKALSRIGKYKYIVLTASDYKGNIPNVEIIRCNHIGKIPSRLSFLLSNLIGYELYYYMWELNVLNKVRKLKKSYNISCIYSRSTPISSCLVGAKLKIKYDLPIIMHFTDPIPAPIGWAPNQLYRRRMINQMKSLARIADIVSFGNMHMAIYQENVLEKRFHKVFISHDPGPEGFHAYPILKKEISSEIRLLYLGNIYGNRNPKPLFEAIQQLSSVYNIKLDIYGDVNSVAYDNVRCFPKVSNIFEVMSTASILVDIDGDDNDPVFISSKLKDYLSTNRYILCISPQNSPTEALTKTMKSVSVVRNRVDLIKDELIRIIERENSIDYSERLEILKLFSSEKIALDIIENLNILTNENSNS